MNRLAASALSLVLAFCIPAVSHAAGFHGGNNPSTAPAKLKVKLVRFHLRNDTKTPLLLQLGDRQLTVNTGATTSLKLAKGEQIVTVNAAGNAAAGSVLSTVGAELQGNTVVVN